MNIAYVPRERWAGVAGNPSSRMRYCYDAVTGEAVPELILYRKYGAVYDLDIDATFPADPEVIKRFKAGEIELMGAKVRGKANHQSKYELDYSWGRYTIVDYAEGEDREFWPGTNYVIRCECGRERIVKSCEIGKPQSCIDCVRR